MVSRAGFQSGTSSGQEALGKQVRVLKTPQEWLGFPLASGVPRKWVETG